MAKLSTATTNKGVRAAEKPWWPTKAVVVRMTTTPTEISGVSPTRKFHQNPKKAFMYLISVHLGVGWGLGAPGRGKANERSSCQAEEGD